MTTRTPEATIRWAIRKLDENPHHQGARALLETAVDGPAIYAADARAALDRAAEARTQQPPPDNPGDDWPASWR